MRLKWFCGACALILAYTLSITPAAAIDTQDTRLLTDPAISDSHIAFSYAGDLWVADRDGSNVRRLTSHIGTEGAPRFSPDGEWIAFSGQYDGNTDVFVVPTAGGVPKRLTWHPDNDVVQDFTRDGSAVLFRSPRNVHTNRHQQLFTVPVEGGFPEQLPIPHANHAVFSPDGSKIAYTPLSEPFNQWKHYRGGRTTRIWIYDREDHSVVEVPQPPGRSNDTDPMWIGDKVYFRSDRSEESAGEFNLFSFDPATETVEQLTSHEDFPVLAASAGGDAIVYEQAGYLHRFDPSSGESERLVVGVAADLVETRARYEDGEEFIRAATLSPTGVRAAFESRGEIFSVPAEKGDTRNLTQTTDAHERSPAWSPDGRWIAHVSDASGEYRIHLTPQDGKGEPKSFAVEGGAGYYEDLKWSPDGEKLSFTDNSWSLYVLDVASGDVTQVDQEPVYGPFKSQHHAWSPDSRWLAYTRITPTYFQRVHLYSLEDGTSTALTDGLADVSQPVFDASGKYLWFLSSTDAGPNRAWFAQSNNDARSTNTLYLAVLSADEKNPLAAENQEVTVEDDEAMDSEADDEGKKNGSGSDKKGENGENGDVRVTVDFEDLHERIVSTPVPPASYVALVAGTDGQVYLLENPPGGGGGGPFGGGPSLNLHRFDVESREVEKLGEGVRAFDLSHDRKKMLYGTGGSWHVVDAGKIEGGKGKVPTGSMRVKVDPREEWPQIFHEAWRINRDYFYDPGMHGADWPAVRETYAAFLPHVTSRDDLSRVITWMLSELSVGHSYQFGGDSRDETEQLPGGLLGADYEVDGDRYRFRKVYGGLNWNPELRSPLTEPGVNVKAGEYLLAVDGEELRYPDNLYGHFEATAGTIVELTVGPNPDGSGSRTVEVVPIEDEQALRNRDWVEGNLKKVHEATDGRVAYVYVPDTAGLGHTYFKRYFYPQADKDAIIVDERYNGGGQIADYYIDILRRPHLSYWTTRYGGVLETPLAAIQGPKVMLIDETAGSGGDMLPWMFRKLDMGPLIGKRTWGGLVGILGFPVLMDGGFITAPNIAFWTEDEGYGVENEGVPPDIEVEQWPAQVIEGHDPQLEKAIEVVLRELEENPPPETPEPPPFPTRVMD